MAPKFELSEATEAEFPELVECMWDTYENPLQNLYRIFCPLNASGSTTRAEAIKESTARFWTWHTSDPTSLWHKVVDSGIGKVVGGALWKIHQKNPYETEPKRFDAYWHPEGGQREFATQAFWQHEAVRERMAARPHVYLNIILVHPTYQKQGLARLMLEWGIRKAEEMGVEMWLDAWQYGRPVYEKFGFVVVEHHQVKPATDRADDEWKVCERDWTGLDEWVMWRPKDGPYIEGKSVKPWEEMP